jgi:hypothetical protein
MTDFNQSISVEKAKSIEQACYKYVFDLCTKEKIADDHGYPHAKHVAELAQIGLSDFSELGNKERLLVILAALMHDIDDPKVFKTSNYENATAFLRTTALSMDDQDFVITMIHLVSYSKNKNSVPSKFPTWAFIPRDADRIAGGGHAGIQRTIEFNEGLGCNKRPMILDTDLQRFNNSRFPIQPADVQELFDSTETKQRSMFEFYITNWHDRGICASGSPKLRNIFDIEYKVLLDFWVGEVNRFYRFYIS